MTKSVRVADVAAPDSCTVTPNPGAAGTSGPQPELPSSPNPPDEQDRQRRLKALSRGIDLYLELEDLAEDWLDAVCGPDLDRTEAIRCLIAGLKGGLLPKAPPMGWAQGENRRH